MPLFLLDSSVSWSFNSLIFFLMSRFYISSENLKKVWMNMNDYWRRNKMIQLHRIYMPYKVQHLICFFYEFVELSIFIVQISPFFLQSAILNSFITSGCFIRVYRCVCCHLAPNQLYSRLVRLSCEQTFCDVGSVLTGAGDHWKYINKTENYDFWRFSHKEWKETVDMFKFCF